MADCGCEKARRELEEFVRGELCTEDATDIREHLEHCSGCNEEMYINSKLTEAVQRACEEDAPKSLRQSVLDALREMQSTHEPSQR